MQDRDYKIFRAGEYYHVYNRGNNKQPIFLDTQDYLNFLKRLHLVLGTARVPLVAVQGAPLRIKPLPANSFTLASYCLMPNHFHFLIRQNTDMAISKLIHKLCTSYTAYFNNKYNYVGHLFQDQFKAKLVNNDTYFKYLSAYIHNNHSDPLHYSYSSFQDVIGKRNGVLCDINLVLGMFNNSPEEYKKFVLDFSYTDKKLIEHLLFEDGQ